MTDANATHTDAASAHGANWIDAWLETQRNWLGRWQSTTMEQRTDAMRASMETLHSHLDPQALSPEALNLAHSFQQLLQAGLQASGEWTRLQTEQEGMSWLQMPALGPAREHQLAWQRLLRAQLEYQIRWQALLGLYSHVFSQSLAAVPTAVTLRAEQGRPVQGLRELYELWIECGETEFARLAHDDAFISAQSACGNAMSQLKLAQNALIEQWLRSHDLPTRSELNSLHQRVRDLQTQIAGLGKPQTAANPARKSGRRKPDPGHGHE